MWNVDAAIPGVILVLTSAVALFYATFFLSGISNDLINTSSSDPAALTYTGIVGAIGGTIFALFGIYFLYIAYLQRKPTPSIRPYLSRLTLKQEVPKPVAITVIAFTIAWSTAGYAAMEKLFNIPSDMYHLILKLVSRNQTSTATSPTDYRPSAYNYTLDYGTYNFTFGIKIEKPSGWLDNSYQVKINDTAITLETQKSLPQNVSNNTYRARVLVDIQSIPRNMPLDVFTQAKIRNLQTSQSFHLITSNSTMLSGGPAHQIVFTYQFPTGKDLRKGMQLWTLKYGKAYVIEYSAGPGVDKFNIELPVVRHIVNSFQITQ
jgi:hypothetical protein